MQAVQVPTQSTVGSRFRQLGVAHVHDRTGEEVLRRSVQPAQHEQPVLAGGRATLLQPGDRSSAERMIGSPSVEVGRLAPQLVREFEPVPGHAGPFVCEVIGYGPLAEDADRDLAPGMTVTVTGHTANPDHVDWAPGRWLEATGIAVSGDVGGETVVDGEDAAGVDLSGLTPPW